LAKLNEINTVEQAGNQIETSSNEATPKRLFVEPEISVPVDVLEATTFFQASSSGATN